MSAEMNETRQYRVDGMSCGNCERHVREAVESLEGVIAVEASSGDSRLTVTGSGVDDQAVATAVSEAGYELVGPAA